ncbi:hypothetical protein P0D88_34985 [Paraburkholderia sp. RL18-103-BIB-C]|uniref:hypothetical protein n=1 Tax=Paraburkholderia sp. RL18-103-BIB-C TaxID=3031637 RepID=UPI0038BC25B9
MDNGNSYTYFQGRALRIISEYGPVSALEIAALYPATLRTVIRALNALHSTHAIYVKDYRRNFRGGNPRKFWSAGPGVDARRPMPTTAAERFRAWQRALTAEQRDFIRARARALARKPRRDPLTRAFYGPAPTVRSIARIQQ